MILIPFIFYDGYSGSFILEKYTLIPDLQLTQSTETFRLVRHHNYIKNFHFRFLFISSTRLRIERPPAFGVGVLFHIQRS